MQFSYSRVNTFAQCPYKFKLQYLDEAKTIRDPAADDALIVGSAMHKGIEEGVGVALDWYGKQFSVLTDLHVNEMIKLETLIFKARRGIDPDCSVFEVELCTPEFLGFVDLVTTGSDGTITITDFKHSNNVDKYLGSEQLHVYKYFFEKLYGRPVTGLNYLFIPKTAIRQRNAEDLYQFRKRLAKTLAELDIKTVDITYDSQKVERFFDLIRQINAARDFPKNPTKLCDWCQYQKFCMEGMDEMLLLPENKRIPVDKETAPVLWLYGVPFSGKTTFANQAPDVLHLNTDGNVKYVDGARIIIKDEIKLSGRIKETVFAWQMFKEAVETLCIGDHEFRTIVIDLVEDLLEHCRIYMYDKLGITHEADAGYGKGYDMVRTEFLPQIRRLTNAGYGVILISHEITAEITKRSGEKITTIRPNLQEKYANKIAGMVDIVGRVIIEEDDSRWIKFKTDTIQFGGGRLLFDTDRVELDYGKFMALYQTAKPEIGSGPSRPTPVPTDHLPEATEPPVDTAPDKQQEATPRRRSRKSS